jgi:hypothetical protein
MLDRLREGKNRKYPVATHQAKNRTGKDPSRKGPFSIILRKKAFFILS